MKRLQKKARVGGRFPNLRLAEGIPFPGGNHQTNQSIIGLGLDLPCTTAQYNFYFFR